MTASSPSRRPHTPHARSSGSASGGSSASGPRPTAGAVPTGAGPITGVPSAPLTRPHGPTTRALLQIEWDYPVYNGGPATLSDAAPNAAQKRVLPAAEALRFIARDDPRPLLVVRECARCNRTDRALLSPGADNEKTILYTRWFHCVKLSMDVSQHDHPLHALFPRDDAEHLFVCNADGSGRMALESNTSRTELWSAMSGTLARSYAADVDATFKQLATLVDGFDLSDQKLTELDARKSRVMETDRFDPGELKKLQDEIAKLRAALAQDLERVGRLSKAELQPKSKPAGG